MKPKPTSSEATVDTMWKTLAQELATVSLDPQESLRPSASQSNTPTLPELQNALTLPRLVLKENADAASPGDLVVHHILGEGSMGRVYLANQVALHRDVAVKTIVPEKDSAKLTEMLLRETWMTGQLEHPNIVPVHLLGIDSSGHPMLVMKKIEGQRWSDLIQSPHKLSTLKEENETPLEWHINILMQVCHAIEFAHSKGVIHRDLKPANVMIGAFGEVYTLDWGLAAKVEQKGHNPAHLDPFPTLADLKGIAGTPAYMAPEMVQGNNLLLDYRTDLYLLGAILHEIAAGSPPHSGETITQILQCALESKPCVYNATVPQELQDICHKAMHVDPTQRFEDVKTFRRTLQNFLKHQESHRLSAASLQLLQELIQPATPTRENAPQSLQDGHHYERLGRCHFGFRRALEIWPENREARDGLQQLAEWMVEFELSRNQLQSAMRWLTELPIPRPDLKARIKTSLEQQQKEIARIRFLEHLEFEIDLSASHSLRRKAAFALSIFWFLLSLLSCTLVYTGVIIPNHYHVLGINLIFVGFLTVTIYGAREIFWANRANRQIVALFALFSGMIIATRLAYIALKVSFSDSMVLEYTTFAFFVGLLGVLYNLRILYGVLVYFIAFLLAYSASDMGRYLILSFAYPVSLLFVAWHWQDSLARRPFDNTLPPPPSIPPAPDS